MQNFEKYGEKPALVDGPTGRSITFKDLPFRIGTAAKGFAVSGKHGGVSCAADTTAGSGKLAG